MQLRNVTGAFVLFNTCTGVVTKLSQPCLRHVAWQNWSMRSHDERQAVKYRAKIGWYFLTQICS